MSNDNLLDEIEKRIEKLIQENKQLKEELQIKLGNDNSEEMELLKEENSKLKLKINELEKKENLLSSRIGKLDLIMKELDSYSQVSQDNSSSSTEKKSFNQVVRDPFEEHQAQSSDSSDFSDESEDQFSPENKTTEENNSESSKVDADSSKWKGEKHSDFFNESSKDQEKKIGQEENSHFQEEDENPFLSSNELLSDEEFAKNLNSKN